MPLARFSLYESGVEIYVASTADDSDEWQATLVHIARESRAFVVAPCHFQRAAAYPEDFPLREALDGIELVGRGGSAILGPDGAYLAGPLYDEEGILYAELDPARLHEERQRFDPAGHYHRPDVLKLEVNAPPELVTRAPLPLSAQRLPRARGGRLPEHGLVSGSSRSRCSTPARRSEARSPVAGRSGSTTRSRSGSATSPGPRWRDSSARARTTSPSSRMRPRRSARSPGG